VIAPSNQQKNPIVQQNCRQAVAHIVNGRVLADNRCELAHSALAHDAGGRNCRADFIQSISFRKKRIRDLETILFNDPIDHGFIDFIEELNTITLRAYRSNTTLCFEEFGVDEHRFVQSIQDEHARLPEGASTTGQFEQRSVKLSADIDHLHDTDHDTVMAAVTPRKALLLDSKRFWKGKAGGVARILSGCVFHSDFLSYIPITGRARVTALA
jgi:hypothetical protein